MDLSSLFQDHIRLQITKIGDKKLNETNDMLAHMYSFPWNNTIKCMKWKQEKPNISKLSIFSLQLLFTWEKMLKNWYLNYWECNKTGTKIWYHSNVPIFSKELEPLQRVERKNIKERRSFWVYILRLTSVPLRKIFNLELLKLNFLHLPTLDQP